MSLDPERTAVILDQQPLWVDALEELLRPLAIDVVAKTTSAAVALEMIATRQPALFLMDFDIDDQLLGALECLRKVRDFAPGLKIIVLSGRGDADTVETTFAAGALAYVVKTAQPEDIVVAVGQAFNPSIFLRSVLAPGFRPMVRLLNKSEPGLTRRELEILRVVSEGHSNAQVARMLWVTEQTVKFHLSNIYRKLDVGNRTEASRWAQLHGVLALEEQND